MKSKSFSTFISSNTRNKTISFSTSKLNSSNSGRKNSSALFNKNFSTTNKSKKTFSSLVPYKTPAKDLVKFNHPFVTPTKQNQTGMVPGTEKDTVIPKGTTVFQAQVPGGYVGNWVSTNPGQTPNQSGISPYGTTKVFHMTDGKNNVTLLPNNQGVMHNEGVSEVISKKRLNTYTTSHDLAAVESLAKEITDNWSIKGVPYNAIGGGGQYLIRDKKFLASPLTEGAKSFQELRSEAEKNSSTRN